MHVMFGVAALCAALYFLFSDTLSLGIPRLDPSYRVRLFVTGSLSVSAYSLAWRSWRPDSFGYIVVGYSSAAIGSLAAWLYISGTSA